MKLGSLFDGSGGFPLAGAINGVTPVWSSEIEAYPMRVTAARFPNMRQLGDVTKIDGAAVEAVDIITFGSPCQDLSVAGKQKGIHEGERSSLFFEAIRIAKEMRAHDRATGRTGVDIRPRFLVWENVPGAFSSNQGEDFRAVLEAIGGITQDGVSIPRPPKGKWQHAGCVVGDGWSLAWRLYDAQYWGVPQRRKRIYLIADLASERAGEILFERESLCGDSAQGGEARQGVATHAPGGAGGSSGVKCLNPWDAQSIRQYDADGIYPTLNANATGGLNRQGVVASFKGGAGGSSIAFHLQQDPINGDVSPCIGGQHQATVGVCAGFVGRQGAKSGSVGYEVGNAPTLRQGITSDVVYALQGNGIDRALTAGCNGAGWRENESYTLNTIDRHGVAFSAGFSDALGENAQGGMEFINDKSPTLRAGDAKAVVYDCRGNGDGDTVHTLTGDHERRVTDYTALCVGNGQLHQMSMAEQSNTLDCMHDQQAVLMQGDYPRKYIVRRLTPLECCRLQGFPDWWEEGVEGSDSARYKMWGNGIALPCAEDVLRRIAKTIKEESP